MQAGYQKVFFPSSDILYYLIVTSILINQIQCLDSEMFYLSIEQDLIFS